MWLVLCEAGDLAALWAARGLAERGLRPVEIFTPEALVFSPHIVHRVTTSSAVVEITTADGRFLDSSRVAGTLNRIQTLPTSHFRGASLQDRQYAEQELHALFLSWMTCLPGRTLNPPSPLGLGGAARHPSEWAWLASQVGLSTSGFVQGDSFPPPPLAPFSRPGGRSVIVVDGIVVGSQVPETVSSACIALASESRTPLLGIEFLPQASGEWLFESASPLPDLRRGGPSLLDALAGALQS